MNKLAYRIQSLRPRTLPLSVSGIILGSFLAYPSGNFSWPVFGLALLTTLSLQIVSNLANDLGDMKHGTDNENRLGPTRALQAGALSVKDYKRTVAGFCLLAVFFGISLIYKAFGCLFCANSYILLCGGTLAILAALGYTLGTRPYGYRGLGDVFVFLFFGLLSTCGSYFLMRPVLSEIPLILLPASGAGFFITGVLNVNNMRDRENDARWIHFYCGYSPLLSASGISEVITVHHSGANYYPAITWETQQWLKPWHGISYSRFYCNGGGVLLGMTTPEMYLIKAECEARAGNATAAAEDLKTLRRTRFYDQTAAENIGGSVQEVLDERTREMGTFWRFFDIKRLNGAENAGIHVIREILTDPTDITTVTTLDIAPDDPRWALPFYNIEAEMMGWEQNGGWVFD